MPSGPVNQSKVQVITGTGKSNGTSKASKVSNSFLSEYAAITSLLLPFRPRGGFLGPAAVTKALRSGTRPPAPISTRWKDMCKCLQGDRATGPGPAKVFCTNKQVN